jgi:alpha-1,2-mannosyltransferase
MSIVGSPRPTQIAQVARPTPGRGRALREALRWLVPAAFLVLVWFLFVGHLPRSDFVVFLRAGGDVLHGRNPYPTPGTSAVYSGSAFVYPWLTAFLFVPLTFMSAHAADIAYFALSGAAVVVGCRVAGLKDPISIVLVLAAATTIRGFQVGSLNALLFLGCVLAWQYRDRPTLAAAPLTLVVGSKLFLLPLLGWTLLSKRWSVFIRTIAGMFLLFAASFLLGPLSAGSYARLLGSLATHEGVQGFSLYGLLTQTHSVEFARIGCAALAACLVFIGWWASRGRGARGEVALFGATIAAALVLTPVLWSHYILLALVPIVVCRPRRLVLLVVSALTWVIAAPASTPKILDLTDHGRALMFDVALVALVLALAFRAVYMKRPTYVKRPARARSSA